MKETFSVLFFSREKTKTSSLTLKNCVYTMVIVNFIDLVVTSYKYLGVVLSQSLTWADHIETLSNKIAQRIGLIRRIKHLLPVHARITLANCLVIPLFDYADFVWGDKNNLVLMNQIQTIQNCLAKVILDLQPRSSASEALRSLNWYPLVVRRKFHRCIMMHKCLNGGLDFDFNFKHISDVHSYNTRNKQNLYLHKANGNYGKLTFTYQGATDWNMLPLEMLSITDFRIFKLKLRKLLFV